LGYLRDYSLGATVDRRGFCRVRFILNNGKTSLISDLALNQVFLGMTVMVYRNLHRQCWSVVDAKTKLVVLRPDWLILDHAKFVVSLAGRNRAVREGRRNVHAKVKGQLIDWDYGPITDHEIEIPQTRVTYNPFRLPYFHRADTNQEVKRADLVLFDADGAVWTHDYPKTEI